MTVEGLERTKKVEFPFHYSRDKALVHIVAKMSDAPGTLARLTTALGARLNLVGTTSYRLTEDTAIFSGFAEVIDGTDNSDDVQKIAASTKGVIDCKVWESQNGLLVDKFHTGLESGMGEPFIMLSTAGLSQTFNKVVKTFGSGGETLLYLQGKDFGMARFEVYKELFGPTPWQRMNEIAHIYAALGFGEFSIAREDSGKTLRLTSKDCFECSAVKGNGRTCAFVRGLLVGTFSAVFGSEFKGEESECRLKGSKACEFILIPVSK